MAMTQEYARAATWLYQSRRRMFPIVTQERAAEVAGVAVATYRKWERGIGAPDIIQLQRLKKEFGWGQIRDC